MEAGKEWRIPLEGCRRVEVGVKKVLDKEGKRQMGYSNVESGRSGREVEEGSLLGFSVAVLK